ncbi:ComEA family DNA-binding protein [Nocardioides gilvus]|uniref:ComEA family DNA-binding protein n=1 Tax=Nocardioides gilvus TaxID=1735589 RepID=UPI00194DED4A|nr:ComEA family DNA-binding protein [Nocardioides gilvus]
MRNRRPSPEHEQAVARRLALLAAEWDTAKAAGVQDDGSKAPWNPPTRVAGRGATVELPPVSIEPGPVEPGPVEPAPVEFVQIDPVQIEPVPVAVVGAMDLGAVEEPATGEDELPPLVQAPGRHAARRGLRGAPARISAAVPGWFISPVAGARARFSSAHLTWVAVLVAVALGATCWWMLGAKESAVLTPVSASFAGSEPGGSPGASEPAEPTATRDAEGSPTEEAAPPGDVEEVVVDVAGKVRRPGIVVLPAGSRVVDAIGAAGGAKRGVDLTSLNLARRLLDGEQILVGRSAATGVGAAPAPGTPPSPTGALVNLNSASPMELETLPGVGPVTAAAIVEWRERHGGFTAVEDLLEVDGIGEVTLERLAPLVSV